jgi:hypothetical protein
MSIVAGAQEMATREKIDVEIMTARLTPLVARMKQGPARLFVELGENAGDALCEPGQTGVDWQAILRHSHMVEPAERIENAATRRGAPMGGIRRGTTWRAPSTGRRVRATGSSRRG